MPAMDYVVAVILLYPVQNFHVLTRVMRPCLTPETSQRFPCDSLVL